MAHFEARFGDGLGTILTPQKLGARSATCLKFTSDFWSKPASKPRSELASFWCFRRGRFDQKDAHSGYLGISVRSPKSALSRVPGEGVRKALSGVIPGTLGKPKTAKTLKSRFGSFGHLRKKQQDFPYTHAVPFGGTLETRLFAKKRF